MRTDTKYIVKWALGHLAFNVLLTFINATVGYSFLFERITDTRISFYLLLVNGPTTYLWTLMEEGLHAERIVGTLFASFVFLVGTFGIGATTGTLWQKGHKLLAVLVVLTLSVFLNIALFFLLVSSFPKLFYL